MKIIITIILCAFLVGFVTADLGIKNQGVSHLISYNGTPGNDNPVIYPVTPPSIVPVPAVVSSFIHNMSDPENVSEDISGLGSQFYWKPFVTKVTLYNATINWRSTYAVGGSIEYATDSYYKTNGHYQVTISDPENVNYHHNLINGLVPATLYHYRVQIAGEYSDDRKFTTLPENGPFSFIVYGDTREQSGAFTQEQRHKYVADAIALENNISFVVHVGDTCERDIRENWTQFMEAGTNLFANHSIYTTLGNHEYTTSVTPNIHNYYTKAFNLPDYYSFDCSSIRFLMINTQDPANSASPSSAYISSQIPWIKTQEDIGKSGFFVFFHRPVWNAGSTSPVPYISQWIPEFESYGMSGIFSGHVHSYQRIIVNNLSYYIVGTGGEPLYTLSNIKPSGYKYGLDTILGYEKITVYPSDNWYTAKFIGVALSNPDQSIQVFNPPVEYDLVSQNLTPPPEIRFVDQIFDINMDQFMINLSINGSHFRAGNIVQLENGYQTIIASDVKINSPTSISCSFSPPPPSGYWNVVISADYSSTTAIFHQFFVSPVRKTGELNLTKGWNFISVPYSLADDHNQGGIFSRVKNANHSIYKYVSGENRWVLIKNDTIISPNTGFWIYSAEKDSIQMIYNHNSSEEKIMLLPGWNSVGFPLRSTESLVNASKKINGDWKYLVSYNSSEMKYDPLIGNDGSANNTREISPYLGYWIYK